jgi:hypothetical protein
VKQFEKFRHVSPMERNMEETRTIIISKPHEYKELERYMCLLK